jgi:hypothetical protein
VDYDSGSRFEFFFFSSSSAAYSIAEAGNVDTSTLRVAYDFGVHEPSIKVRSLHGDFAATGTTKFEGCGKSFALHTHTPCQLLDPGQLHPPPRRPALAGQRQHASVRLQAERGAGQPGLPCSPTLVTPLNAARSRRTLKRKLGNKKFYFQGRPHALFLGRLFAWPL